jgi:broad specificity phosphatase PhoE
MNGMNEKLLFIVRHGERTDKVGLIPRLHVKDPELTEKGKKQAFEIGKIIQEKLRNDYRIDNNKKVLIISSPFARTIQTAKQILFASKEQIEPRIEEKIFVKNLLCEILDEGFHGYDARYFLSVYNQTKSESVYNSQFDSNYFRQEINDIEIEFLDEKEQLPLSETESDCIERVSKCIECGLQSYLKRDDVGGVIYVSHASPIDYFNRMLGYKGPYGWGHINYCTSFVYSIDVDSKLSKFLERLDIVKEV